MFITKTNKVRHLLLQLLAEETRKHQKLDLANNSIHFNKICEKLDKYEQAFLLDNLDYLQNNKFIYCSMQSEDSRFHILSNGNHAFHERKFLREGVKDQMNYIYDILKNISVIVLLIIGVWTFVTNINQTRENTKTIKELHNRVQSLEDSSILRSRNINFKKL